MPYITALLCVICILLVSCAATLVYIAQQRRVEDTRRVNIDTSQLMGTLARINSSIEHHAEISAVLGLMKQLDADPDAMLLIKSYPKTVRAAAMLHYINSLGSALQHAQTKLANLHKTYGTTHFTTKSAQQSVNDIRQKLNSAVAASEQIDSTS